MSISNQQLQQQIQQMPEEITPDRDLWPGIEKAIAYQQQTSQKKASWHMKPMMTMAASVAFVALGWIGVTNFQPEQGGLVPVSIVAQMNQQFEQQKQLLLTSYGQPDTANLSTAMLEELTQLANARKSLEKALADDEDNVDLLNLLQWTQQQELELIEQLYRPQWQTI